MFFLSTSLVTGQSFISISSLVRELWQFSFIRDRPKIQKLEIPPSGFVPIYGHLGELGITNLARMSLIKSYWILQNFRTTTFTIFGLLRENQQVVKLRPTHQPKLGLKKCLLEYLELLIFLTIKNYPGKIKNASLNLLLLIYIPINTLKKN